jgi:hypothetical protein
MAGSQCLLDEVSAQQISALLPRLVKEFLPYPRCTPQGAKDYKLKILRVAPEKKCVFARIRDGKETIRFIHRSEDNQAYIRVYIPEGDVTVSFVIFEDK